LQGACSSKQKVKKSKNLKPNIGGRILRAKLTVRRVKRIGEQRSLDVDRHNNIFSNFSLLQLSCTSARPN
jgi:hypothetical protein